MKLEKKRKLFAIDLQLNKILSDCNQYDNLKFDTILLHKAWSWLQAWHHIHCCPEEASYKVLNAETDSEKVIHAEKVSKKVIQAEKVINEATHSEKDTPAVQVSESVNSDIIIVANEKQIATLPFSNSKRSMLLDKTKDLEKDDKGNLVTPLKIRRTRRKGAQSRAKL